MFNQEGFWSMSLAIITVLTMNLYWRCRKWGWKISLSPLSWIQMFLLVEDPSPYLQGLRVQQCLYRLNSLQKQHPSICLFKVAYSVILELTDQIYVDLLRVPSINHVEVTVVDPVMVTWMTLILQYLNNKIVFDDDMKARKVRSRTEKYAILNGSLLRKIFMKMEVEPSAIPIVWTNKSTLIRNSCSECGNYLGGETWC